MSSVGTTSSASAVERTLFRVVVGEIDITPALRPILHALRVADRAGQVTDTAEIELNDLDGRIVMPPAQAAMAIWLGNKGNGLTQVFSGFVDEIRSKGSRGSGRMLTITAKGFDTLGPVKEPVEQHFDNTTLAQTMNQAAVAAGLSGATVDPTLSAITRPYWAQQSESFLHFGQRLAKEVGGTFKIVGNRAIMAARNGGTSASGLALNGITAAWGRNLITWDIAPVISRPRYRAARGRSYDFKGGKWKGTEKDVPGATSTATHVIRSTKADEGEAGTHAGAEALASERQAGMGTLVIDGNTDAQPEADCTVTGTRPGIDGVYRIDGVTQELSRGSGFLTHLEVRQPQGVAGVDYRATPGAAPPAAAAAAASSTGSTAATGTTTAPATASSGPAATTSGATATTSSTSSGSVSQALVAGDALSGHRALMYSPLGQVVYADPGSTGYAFAGISMQAAVAGAPLQVVDIGPVTEVSWSWTPLAAVFVGPLGVLTQIPPTSGISHIIGYATAAQTLMLAPQTPVLIE